MVFVFKYSIVLYRHVAKDPVKFLKFSQVLENLFEKLWKYNGGEKIFSRRLGD